MDHACAGVGPVSGRRLASRALDLRVGIAALTVGREHLLSATPDDERSAFEQGYARLISDGKAMADSMLEYAHGERDSMFVAAVPTMSELATWQATARAQIRGIASIAPEVLDQLNRTLNPANQRLLRSMT